MKASAPGKVVISGAYAVLRGAPAIVASADRRVVADSERASEFDSAEVRAAADLGYLSQAPYYDATPLRQDGRKLGLGSSAAILVACMAAGGRYSLTDALDDPARKRLFADAKRAHRLAQQGGSGIDVAAATFGGFLQYQFSTVAPPLGPSAPTRSEPIAGASGERATSEGVLSPAFSDDSVTCAPLSLPSGLTVEVWGAEQATNTQEFVVRVLRAVDAGFEDAVSAFLTIAEGATQAVTACRARSKADFLNALDLQQMSFEALGVAAGVEICTTAAQRLARLARHEGAIFTPAGAGGGDISLFVGEAPSSAALRAEASALNQFPLPLQLGGPGARIHLRE